MNRLVIILLAALVAAFPAQAAPALDGTTMGFVWVLPFAGILLSIASGPLLFRKFWHDHYGKIGAAWALITLGAVAFAFGPSLSLAAFAHAILTEYLSFIIVLFALYVVAGGILIEGDLRGTPATNTGILALGTAMASVVGTTGAAIILVRPLIRANRMRQYNAHVVVFFIFLVANIGGALSPLGDPPLFVGFLRGVDFLWAAKHLWAETALIAVLILAVFVALDAWLLSKEPERPPAATAPIRLRGKINLPLIAAIVAAIMLSALWRPGIALTIYGTRIELQNLVRDGTLVAIALVSLWLTPEEHRAANDFTWEPILEVAKLFAAIFTCIIPVLAMLQAGRDGAFAWLLNAVTAQDSMPHALAYFWLTGILSAFLDNAPTYLVFFELAGGKADELMGPLAPTLAAISMGAVYMGALTYIGNAPNFIVYAIAEEHGVGMPGFFGYMLWSGAVLLPAMALVSIVFL